MKRLIAAAAVGTAAVLAALPASARTSVGISLSFAEPGFYGSVNLGAPLYVAPPSYYYYTPAPTYYYSPAPVYYGPSYAPHPRHRDWRDREWRDRDWRDRDRDGVPNWRDRDRDGDGIPNWHDPYPDGRRWRR